MSRECRKAFAKGVNALGDVIEVFADTYSINSKVESAENLSESTIKGTENMTLLEKAEVVENVFSKLKRK
jgi:hypothetical protein